ncbi:MAG: peptidylprolyl isomerase [Elusimicrobiota bacterium]|nr:peptidylprolyl isomerase [Elusimicrobiota bacterium]
MRALCLAGLFVLTACGSPPRRAAVDLASGRAALRAVDAKERARAAWDLGQLGLADVPEGEAEPPASVSIRAAAAESLIPAVSDPDPIVRRAAIQSLGKTGGANIENTLHSAATDIDSGVRGEVALALFRMRFLKRVPEYSTSTVNKLLTLANDSDHEVRWRAIYAFSRFPDARAEKMLMQASKDPDKVTRLFAVRSLSKLGRRVDVSLLSDPDLHVRAEAAAAFGAAKAAGELPLFVYLDSSAHVRAAAADAVSATGDAGLASRLEKMASSDTPLPRGRALIALAKLSGVSSAPLLERSRKDPHWWVRSRAYEASVFLPDAPAILSVGVADPDPRVAAQALETLAASTSPLAGDALERVLRDPKAELELIGTAVDAATERKSPAFAGPLRAAWGRADLTAELRDSVRKALKASGVMVAAGPALDPPKTFPPLTSSPTLVLETEKGTVELLLDASAAPNTAAAIADAARRGVYDGTIWHRVVTAFVVQGGDPRGSGWGDDGFRLADEANPLPFLRGTLGMPKAGPDTGGCQLFISLIPTPHLDGRYTAFGRVLSGEDVLDALEPGDKILKARLR